MPVMVFQRLLCPMKFSILTAMLIVCSGAIADERNDNGCDASTDGNQFVVGFDLQFLLRLLKLLGSCAGAVARRLLERRPLGELRDLRALLAAPLRIF